MRPELGGWKRPPLLRRRRSWAVVRSARWGQHNGETLRQCLAREVEDETSAAIRVGRLRRVREFISANREGATLDTPNEIAAILVGASEDRMYLGDV